MLLQSAGRKLYLALVVLAAGELSFGYVIGWNNTPDSTDADRRFSGNDLGPLKNHSFMYFPIR
jgi:hypothetical protein